jgi:hypothetical protein
MPSTTRRHNRAFRVAYWADIQRIYYTATLSAYIHGWAFEVLRRLIPSAITVLQFLAALHRAGKGGYLGCAVAYSMLAPQIAQATGRPCSVRTLERGLACLKMFGLIDLRYWTMPDQRITVCGREIVVRGTGKVRVDADNWRSLQIRIVTLTDRAVSLWDRATGSQSDRVIPHLPTSAKLADRSQKDQCVITHMVRDNKHRVPTTKAPSDNVEQGKTTRPVDSTGTPSDPTLEHRSSTPDTTAPGHQTESPPSTRQASNESSPPRGEAPSLKARGCSEERPRIPRGVPSKRAYPVGCAYILSELHRTLERFSQREADALYLRAKWELSRDYPAGWPTAVDWSYWVGRFGDMPLAQRRYHVMRDILPLLRSPAAITPDEPHRIKMWRARRAPQPIGGVMAPWLEKLKEKFCGDD